MSISNSNDFLFVPSSTNSITGTLYELKASESFEKDSFVLLPYQNPQTKKLHPQFYKVILKKQIQATDFENTEEQKETVSLKAKTSKENYIQKVLQLKEHIQLGNIYEINYCIQFYANDISIDPLSVFSKLHRLAKAPYSALLKIGDEFIMCASPELFLKKEGNQLSTKPIKGTIRRGSNEAEDEDLKNQLHTHLKERTENVMAVDVARNDLSHFAARGSVRVNKLYNIETFETVHQMVSTVSCEIKENTNFEKIIESAFPMASMTGAPKLRAMTLIDEYEDFERDNYSGAMGLIDENEDFTLSVIIRSIFYDQKTKRLSLSVGGAITYLSEPEKEYEECLLKAKALLKVLNAEIV